MSTLEPEGIDWVAMEALFDEVDTSDDLVVSSLDNMTLLETYHTTISELEKLGEMLNQKTQEGRDLHSQRTACLVEIRKRKLLQ